MRQGCLSIKIIFMIAIDHNITSYLTKNFILHTNRWVLIKKIYVFTVMICIQFVMTFFTVRIILRYALCVPIYCN